jgi:thymidylate synthase
VPDDRENTGPSLLAEIVAHSRRRAELEAEYGQVWDADELNEQFAITAIIPPVVVVRRKIDGAVGNRYLFQTRRNTRYTARRVQQIVKLYAEKAG